ncbi:MAG: cobyrinate a,c-diamide synthase [Sulfuricaulis sp.]
METARRCPALLVSAPASGAGKTTVTAAMARLYRNHGQRVRVFKTGPDFLDPMILERASGNPVYQLDLWMGGAAHCRQLLFEAAGEADLILVEGVMGLFDGRPSSADLAQQFNIPVLAVIDAGAMAQTFGAVSHGLAAYRHGLPFAGVFANRVGGAAHADMLVESLPPGIRLLGALPRNEGLTLPDRHLGLVQAVEIEDLEQRLERAVEMLEHTGDFLMPQPVTFAPEEHTKPPHRLRGTRIACAHDRAFSFIYRSNLDLLEAMGAEIVFFSPLEDKTLPDADGLWLPGGYPELHLEQLAANRPMHQAIRAHHAQGKPIVAECGGMLYLLESLTDAQGRSAPMAGVLPGNATMQTRLANLGLQEIRLPEGTLRGHTFHHSRMETTLAPLAQATDARVSGRGEPAYRVGRLHASYLHSYFPSNPETTARLFLP